jgi:hypothetical protein
LILDTRAEQKKDVKPDSSNIIWRPHTDSEIAVHFYIKYVSSAIPKDKMYDDLQKELKGYGVKEICFMEAKNPKTYEISLGFKNDDDANHIYKQFKLKNFLQRIGDGQGKPRIILSNLYSTIFKTQNEASVDKERDRDQSYHGKRSPRKRSYSKERDHEKARDSKYDKKDYHSRSRDKKDRAHSKERSRER